MLLKVRFHGRGGQGVKTSSRILGQAAFLSGFVAQDSPIYGAERRGAPVAGFTRISDEPILERGYIFDPHMVIVMDDTLLGDWLAKPLEGLAKGGVVFVNTYVDTVSVERGNCHVVNYNLTEDALKFLGRAVISTAAAAAAAKLTGIIEKSAVLQATVEELSEIGLDEETVEKNLKMVGNVYDTVPKISFHVEGDGDSGREIVTLTPDRVVFEEIINTGNSYLRKTGNWRIFKPVVDYGKCTGCMICFIYCPESVISLDSDNKPIIDYDNCKGCMICMVECPLKAITAVKEVKTLA
ncbi:MAG: 2-oxoacid:acceptor oxidoreductase family protein [Candidatus Caldarchaeum sp.]